MTLTELRELSYFSNKLHFLVPLLNLQTVQNRVQCCDCNRRFRQQHFLNHFIFILLCLFCLAVVEGM